MKVAISTFGYDDGKSGMGIYIREISQRISEDLGPDQVLLLGAQRDLEAIQTPGNLTQRVSAFWCFPLTNLIWHLFLLPIELLRNRVDVVLLPAANRRATFYSPVPSVGVIHDLSQLHVPGKYDFFRTFYVLKLLPLALRRLSSVIAVSKTTANDVIAHLRISDKKTHVVLNGLNWSDQKRNPLGFTKQDRKFFFYPARIEHPGKNHLQLIRGYKILLEKGYLQYDLVLAGKKDRRADVVFEEIERLGLQSHVKYLGFVSSEDLPALYQQAEAVIFPSFYEGFGLPIIEAFQFRRPIICSNTAIFREIAGDVAWYFQPHSPESIAAAWIQFIESSLQDRELRIKLSFELVRRFDWNQTSIQTLEVLRAAVRRGALKGGS